MVLYYCNYLNGVHINLIIAIIAYYCDVGIKYSIKMIAIDMYFNELLWLIVVLAITVS